MNPIETASEAARRRHLETVPVLRYMLTCIDRDGIRTIIGPAQGRFTHATREEGETYRAAVLSNNGEKTLAEIFGPQAMGTFEVRAIPCYPGHFDPMGVYPVDGIEADHLAALLDLAEAFYEANPNGERQAGYLRAMAGAQAALDNHAARRAADVSATDNVAVT